MVNGIRPTANAISAQATHAASAAPWPLPNSSVAIGPARAKNPTVAGTMTMSASRTVLVNSAATPSSSPLAASREALGMSRCWCDWRADQSSCH